MKNCHKDITSYHVNRVKLTSSQLETLRNRRNANRKRLKKGLQKSNDPQPIDFISQGSYKARTTIQEPKNAYDIDDGAIFLKEYLVGERGGEKSTLDAKKMIRNAVDDGSFKTSPEVKANCVRVHYDDGSHVDIPVYRKTNDTCGKDLHEIASAAWKESNPMGVNEWFEECLSRRSESGRHQMRTLIRLIKAYCKHRPSYSLPNGFILTVLIYETYYAHSERLDSALRNLITAIRDRLRLNLTVSHPGVNENLAEHDDPKCSKLKELLTTSLEDLKILDRANCKRSEALKAWKKVFNTDYFNDAIKKAEQDEKNAAAACVAAAPFIPKPYCSRND